MAHWTPDPAKVITAEAKSSSAAAVARGVYEEAIQAFVDAKPKEKDFRDGVTLASYAASTIPPWQSQALAFIAWRDEVWVYAYTELEKVLAGQRMRPTVEAFIAELPHLTWPESENVE